jgi:hypothetical protein
VQSASGERQASLQLCDLSQHVCGRIGLRTEAGPVGHAAPVIHDGQFQCAYQFLDAAGGVGDSGCALLGLCVLLQPRRRVFVRHLSHLLLAELERSLRFGELLLENEGLRL